MTLRFVEVRRYGGTELHPKFAGVLKSDLGVERWCCTRRRHSSIRAANNCAQRTRAADEPDRFDGTRDGRGRVVARDTLSRMGRRPVELSKKHAAQLRAKAGAYESARDRSNELLDELYREIRRAARAGASMRAIAEQAGVTKARIQQILKEGEGR